MIFPGPSIGNRIYPETLSNFLNSYYAEKGVTIVPVRVENVLPAKELQFFLSNIHWLDAISPPMERRLQEINAKIKPILEQCYDNAAISVSGSSCSMRAL